MENHISFPDVDVVVDFSSFSNDFNERTSVFAGVPLYASTDAPPINSVNLSEAS